MLHRFVVFIGLVLIAGCGGRGDSGPTGTASGRVTFEGQPVTEGTIQFMLQGQGGIAGAVPLQSDGAYALPQPLPVGTYKVSIFPPKANSPEEHQASIAKYPNIPPNYRTDETSPLTAEIEEGPNSIDFDMQPQP